MRGAGLAVPRGMKVASLLLPANPVNPEVLMSVFNRTLCLACCLVVLNGCAVTGFKLASMAATGVSYLITGKSLSDHVISGAMASDCALHRMIVGQPPCRSNEGVLVTESQEQLPDVASASTLDAPQPGYEGDTTSSRFDLVNLSWQEADSLDQKGARLDAGLSRDEPGPRLFVVVGSYREISNAETHVVREDGAQIAPVIIDDTRHYRVVLGPFGSSISTLARSETGLKRTGGWPLWLCPGTLRAPPCATQVAQVAL